MSVPALPGGFTLLRAGGRPRPALPDAVHGENFVVAPPFLPGALRHDLLALYGFARFVDGLGEDRDTGTEQLDAVDRDLQRLAHGEQPELAALVQLAPTLHRRHVPLEPLARLVAANRQDLAVRRYDTFEDLLAYCRLSADPVGEIVLHLVGRADADRVALSNRICTALQLLEHWQDVAEDHRAGRVYLPQDDLRRFGVRDADLAGPGTAQLRALLAFETDRARAWLDAGAPLVSTLHGWARLAVAGYVAGGRAAAAALRAQGYAPFPSPRKPTRRAIAAMFVQGMLRWPG